MPRQPRFVLPGSLHHVTQRGNYRQNVFFDDQDRSIYLRYINRSAKDNGVSIYAFCLMDNHVHFIVKPRGATSLAQTFRVAHQRYSLYLNRRLNSHGHRWQSRFYSCVLLGSHIEHAVRYVECNPVRANMVEKPWQYAWSSAKAHIGAKYRIIELSDIKEYVKATSWKDFLMCRDSTGCLKDLRESTWQGKVFGSLEAISAMEKEFCKNLLAKPHGRPRKV